MYLCRVVNSKLINLITVQYDMHSTYKVGKLLVDPWSLTVRNKTQKNLVTYLLDRSEFILELFYIVG